MMENVYIYFKNKKNMMNLVCKEIRKNIGNIFNLRTLEFSPEI